MGTATEETPDLCTACTATPGLKDAATLCPECKGTPSRAERNRIAKLTEDEAKAARTHQDAQHKAAAKQENAKPSKEEATEEPEAPEPDEGDPEVEPEPVEPTEPEAPQDTPDSKDDPAPLASDVDVTPSNKSTNRRRRK